MDSAHVHLIINHFPIAGMLIAAPVLFMAWRKSNDLLGRTGLLIVLFSGLISIPTFLSGEQSEEVFEQMPGIPEQVIKIHEEAAEKAIWVVGAAAAAALISLFFAYKNKSMPKRAVPIVGVLVICAMAILAWTNNSGGKISHPELRRNSAVTAPAGSESH